MVDTVVRIVNGQTTVHAGASELLVPVLEKAASDASVATASLRSWNDADAQPIVGAFLNRAAYEGSITAEAGITNLGGFQYLLYEIKADEVEWRISQAVVGGGSISGAVWFGADRKMLTHEYDGTDADVPLQNALLHKPASATLLGLCGKSSGSLALQVKSIDPTIGQKAAQTALLAAPSISRAVGAKSAAFGTSIPSENYGQVTSYYGKAGPAIGMTIYNEAEPTSMVRAGHRALVTAEDPYGWTGLGWLALGLSLAMNLAEKQELIDNWDFWRPRLVGNPPAVLNDTYKAWFVRASYENRLIQRHLGANRRDLYIFDHGHNDWGNAEGLVQAGGNPTLQDVAVVPAVRNDRKTFIGGMNFLIDLILADNPRATICFVGHYENARKAPISQAQMTLAEIWNFPILKLWEKLGWSQQVIQSGPSAGKTMTQVWMPADVEPYGVGDIHPWSDRTGRATDRIAEFVAPFLRDVVPQTFLTD